MKFKRAIPILLLLLLLASVLYAEQPRYLEITFLTTNDLHAKLRPFDIPADPAKDITAARDVGGAARRATVIRQVRAEMRTPVFLLDCGDTTHGNTDLAKAYHGEADIAMMNAIGYDAMVPGNHEFEWHSPDTLRNLRDSKFPWVCANLIYADTGKSFVEPYVIRDVWGVRVAFFGLINELINTHPKMYVAGPELGLKVLPAVDVAKTLVPELRQKADIIVLLSHLGATPDTQLAKEVPGIDVILGGHSHTKLTTPRMVSVGDATAFSLGAVPVVQAGYHGMHMGRTRVIFRRDDTGRYTLMSCRGELIPINSSIPDDPGILRIIEDFTKRIPPVPK